MNRKDADLLERLEGRRFGVIGIGNVFKGDDGAGPRLIELLSDGFPLPLADAAEVPENYGGWVIKRDLEVVVFADAVDFGGDAGEFRIISIDKLIVLASDTHRLSLHMMIKYLEEEWGGEPILIGIQPGSLGLGRPLSPEVERGVGDLASLLMEAAGVEPGG